MFDYPTITGDEIATKRGLFLIDHDEYHAGPGVSSSQLKKIKQSPAHAMVEMEDSAALAFGRAFHMAILEPELFEKSYVVMPKFSGTGMKARKAEWMLENADKEVIKEDDIEQINKMVAVVQKSDVYKKIADYDVEVAAIAEDERTGTIIKCKADMLGDFIVDFKTTRDNASPAGFTRTLYGDFDYILSAAFYQDIIHKITGNRLPFLWAVIEKKEPYGLAWYEAPNAALDVGRDMYRKALDKWAECQLEEKWPGYEDKVVCLTPPDWFFRKEF